MKIPKLPPPDQDFWGWGKNWSNHIKLARRLVSGVGVTVGFVEVGPVFVGLGVEVIVGVTVAVEVGVVVGAVDVGVSVGVSVGVAVRVTVGVGVSVSVGVGVGVSVWPKAREGTNNKSSASNLIFCELMEPPHCNY